MTTKGAILLLLQRNPDGLTSRQVGEKLKCASYSASGILSKLYCYGEIDRCTSQGRPIYRMKPSRFTP